MANSTKTNPKRSHHAGKIAPPLTAKAFVDAVAAAAPLKTRPRFEARGPILCHSLLHCRVNVEVFDATGKRILGATYDLAKGEHLTTSVSEAGISAGVSNAETR